MAIKDIFRKTCWNQENMEKEKVDSLLPDRNGKEKVSEKQYEQIHDENTPPPELNIKLSDGKGTIFAGLLIVIIFFGVGGAWVTFGQISSAVIVTGEVRVFQDSKTVQHLEGGIVSEILVRDGDFVEAGQALLILESPRVIAATNQVLLQLVTNQMLTARLMAEKELHQSVSWPQFQQTIPREKFDELLEASEKVFNSGRRALQNQTVLIESQINQLHNQISSINDRLVSEHQIVIMLQEELDAKLILHKENFIDKTQILQLRRAIADRQGNQAQLKGTRAELLERIDEFNLRITATKEGYRQNATVRLDEIQQTIFSLQQKLLPLEDSKSRLHVVAPVSGKVVDMQVHSVKGVVRPGQPILDIVPQDVPLIIECNILAKDITHVFHGQEADVQLLAFSTRTKPRVKGKIVYISADRMLIQTPYGEQSSFLMRLELDKQELIDHEMYLTAGMPVAVFITTSYRTILDYALEPIIDNFDRALREN